LPARPVWGGKRFRNSALAEYQNRNFFPYLKKNFVRGRLKNIRKFFCFARRQAGGNAGRVNRQNPLDFAQRKLGFRPTNTTKK
jgi:hypothetical protein